MKPSSGGSTADADEAKPAMTEATAIFEPSAFMQVLSGDGQPVYASLGSS